MYKHRRYVPRYILGIFSLHREAVSDYKGEEQKPNELLFLSTSNFVPFW